MNETLIDLSRLQFAATALYHFLFVPLTLGLSFLLVIMEATYVMTGKTIYKDMTRFWGKLFGINFALGVTTGITMEFQFGTNWAYYSHYVGDIFGAPLAIEGLMAFFLESTFIGLFFFGWDKLSKGQHLLVTTLTAVGSNLSALWILIANGWMQDPIGAEFSYTTMRMELTDFWAVMFNPTAQAKFVHTVSAGYVTGSLFVLGISAWYLLKGRDVEFARRSFRIAAAFGFASALSVIVLGDESGYSVTESQKSKLAAIEAMWETEPAPAGFNPLAKTVAVQTGAWLNNFRHTPALWLVPTVAVLAGLTGVALAIRRRPLAAFVASALTMAGIIGTAGVALFPFVLPSSSDPRSSLTVWDSVSSHLTLGLMFWATVIFMPLIVFYTSWAYRVMAGKVTPAFIEAHDKTAY